jgi:hypothetical protein
MAEPEITYSLHKPWWTGAFCWAVRLAAGCGISVRYDKIEAFLLSRYRYSINGGKRMKLTSK